MIYIYFGKPRSGKTTFLAEFVRRNEKHKKWNNLLHFDLFHVYDEIYSTDYIRGTKKIKPHDIGTFKPVENSLFLIHEAGIHFNNRSYKAIPSHVTNFMAVHGHYGVDIIAESQSVDIDKKIRDRAEMCFQVNRFGPWSRAVPILKFIGVDNDTHDLVEGYKLPGFFMNIVFFVMGKYQIIYRPFCYDLFDSYSDMINWQKADSDHLIDYPDTGERHTLWQKFMPLLQLIGMIAGWIAALIILWNFIF